MERQLYDVTALNISASNSWAGSILSARPASLSSDIAAAFDRADRRGTVLRLANAVTACAYSFGFLDLMPICRASPNAASSGPCSTDTRCQ